MNHLTMAAAIVSIVFAAGCATTQSISDSDRKAIRSVSIAKAVAMPPHPVVMGKASQTAGFWGGPIATAVMASRENSDVVQFKQHVDAYKIDIGEIVRQEFITQLKATSAFPAIVAEGGNATFDLTIESYGLAQGFSMSPTNAPLRPTVRLTAKLSMPDGKVVWQNTETLTAISSDIPAYPVAEYYSTPGRVEEAFKKAGEIVAKDLLKDLGQQ
jgi:hypothetical protein